jgi:hypothetical protein
MNPRNESLENRPTKRIYETNLFGVRIRDYDTKRIHGFAKRIHVFTNLLYESRILKDNPFDFFMCDPFTSKNEFRVLINSVTNRNNDDLKQLFCPSQSHSHQGRPYDCEPNSGSKGCSFRSKSRSFRSKSRSVRWKGCFFRSKGSSGRFKGFPGRFKGCSGCSQTDAAF